MDIKRLSSIALPAALFILHACGSGNDSCAVGSEGCPCTSGGSCDSDLECIGGVCTTLASDTSSDGDASVDLTADDPPEESGCTSSEDCNDADPCTSDTCDVDFGVCSHDPVDQDDDGYTAREVDGTVCDGGTDCDDGNAARHP